MSAMRHLGTGLSDAKHHEEALAVMEAELSMSRRLGASEYTILVVQSNLAVIHGELGNMEKALIMERDVYSGRLRLHGEGHEETLRAAGNYTTSLKHLMRYAEAKSLLRKAVPVARRTLGAEHDYTLNLRDIYGRCLYRDPGASRDDVAEAIEIMDDVQRRARRVFGPGHPNWNTLPQELTAAREKLASFDT